MTLGGPVEARPAGGEQPSVLVVHCSDGRFQPRFQDFLRRDLGVEHYTLVAVPGGVHFLTLVDYLPKFSWAGWRWVKFLADVAPPTRVILIAHEDCRWYHDSRFGTAPQDPRGKQVQDLQAARAGLVERFGKVPVELYYARLGDGGVVFERL
jgi:hypothetical protein